MKGEKYPIEIINVMLQIRGLVGSFEFVTKCAKGPVGV